MILIVTPIWTDNIAQCEQLLDFIYAQNERTPIATHILLVHPPSIDKEMLERIKISAELAFKGVHFLELRPLTDERAPKWKQINSAFTQAATHISKSFRWSFLWFEPDCVPVRRGWFSRLVLEYGSQPKSYFGTRLKIETPGQPDGFLMARNSVYPINAILDIPQADAPFEIASSGTVLPKFTVSKLIQQLTINGEADLAKVREDAIVVHGDKLGLLRRKLEAEFTEPFNAPNQLNIPIAPSAQPVSESVHVNGAKKRGRKSKAEIEERNARLAASLTVA